eukprot:1936624-Pyramimonas_sp.AAC.1
MVELEALELKMKSLLSSRLAFEAQQTCLLCQGQHMELAERSWTCPCSRCIPCPGLSGSSGCTHSGTQSAMLDLRIPWVPANALGH